MKRKRSKAALLAWLIAMLSILAGCNLRSSYVADIDDTMPLKGALPLDPYWVYEKAYRLGPKVTELDDPMLQGLTMSISANEFALGQNVVEDPDIKVLRAKTYEYFLTSYRVTTHDVGITDEFTEVYTITDAKGFTVKLFKLGDASVAVEQSGVLMFFKPSEASDHSTLASATSPGTDSTGAASEANGVLIGLRAERRVTENILGQAGYRTIWISLDREGSMEIYEVPNILFPRNEFYIMSVDRKENIEVVNESVVVTRLSDGATAQQSIAPSKVSRFSNITFIANDYFSIETRLAEGKGTGPFQYYFTKNLDEPNLEANTKITDIYGAEGLSIMEAAAKAEISQGQSRLDRFAPLDESAFILRRRNGGWEFQGRLNAPEKYSDRYVTFPMDFPDNSKLYGFDAIAPRWADIKATVPNGVDAVSSPEDFFLAVKTEENLLIFKKDNGRISATPVAVLNLHDGETIIMHEWATGSNVNEWGDIVKKLGKPVEELN